MASIPYRFDGFQRELLYHDLRFEGGPAPGEPFPTFDLPAIDGGRLTRDEAVADRPMFMVLASYT
ncbi:MAG: hypothetical protein KY469_06715 [Actinobacteria bacterium]|nr:hypothetical protein [Actinomycetota bacterium]